MSRWLRRAAAGVLGLVALIGLALVLLDTAPGHRLVAARIAAMRPENGLRYSVGRIDGSLYGQARLTDLRVHDLDGLLFQAPRVELRWRPWRWLANELAADAAEAPAATLFHRPHTRPGQRGAILPAFDIAIGRLRIDQLRLAAPVSGRARTMALDGRATVRRGRALVRLDAAAAGSDRIALTLDAEPDRDRFDLDAIARGGADGMLADLLGGPVTLRVAGDGRWAQWRGSARGSVEGRAVLDVNLAAEAGRYRLNGTVAPGRWLSGAAARLMAPGVRITAQAELDRRQVTGDATLRTPALAMTAAGTLDLAESRYRGVRIKARLLRPGRLLDRLTGEGIALALALDRDFARPSYRYRVDGEWVAVGKTGLERLAITGAGRWTGVPARVPVRVSAARVTGIGADASGVLRGLVVEGRLRIAPPLVTGEALTVRSDRLRGALRLLIDLRTGRFDVGLAGSLKRWFIRGVGLVDIESSLRVAPGPGGRARLVGHGTAQVVRLDSGFLRSLTGGLPRLEAALERTPDGILHFTRLTVTAPQIRLAGRGYRRLDGSMRIEGGGAHSRWGPVRLVLDGRIARPRLDLLFAQPNRTLGLRDVRALLDPTAEGYSYRAAGGSRLGPVTAAGRIVIRPAPARDTLVVDALDVTGTRGRGTFEIGGGGLTGRLAVAGGGWSGGLDLDMVDTQQRVRGELAADAARIEGVATVRRGQLRFTTVLDPAGTRMEATAQGQGLQRNRLNLARFAGNLRLVGETGELRASVAGTRGRAFEVRTVTQIAPDALRVSAEGTLDGRALRLAEPARVTREGNGDTGGWRVAPTRLSFAGGEAVAGGRLGGGRTELDLKLTRMPLAILDIGYPRLGLIGTASGSLAARASDGAAPTGRVDMVVRGLARPALARSSRPIDLGLAGVLDAGRLGVRAVAASGGQTIGRAQALLRLGAGGDLAARIEAAPLAAQLRYNGPAETLWRMTGLELFELSGPVRIAADIGGRVGDPQIRGAFQASGARVESATSGTVLTDVGASGRFAGSRLSIERFAAVAGRGGRVTGTGSFDFAAPRGIGMDLAIRAERAVMIARDDLSATVSGPLRLWSDGAGGTIEGDVTLDRASYRLGRAAAAAAVPRLRVREINRPGGEEDEQEDAPVRPWALAVHARAPGGVMVSGLGLASEWSADLNLRGLPSNPAITGLARLVRGNYEFSGRDFALERGVIRFDGSTPANPALDIEANADSRDLNATIRVSGTALKPDVSFASTPALPEDELLSRLLFGTSITNLSAPEALQLAAAVAALQDGGQGLNPINAVRRAAGLDRLRILPADAQTGQGTAIAAGKYVTRRLYGELVTDGQGYSATRVEFQVTRWLSLLSSISTLGRQSANVRVSRDY